MNLKPPKDQITKAKREEEFRLANGEKIISKKGIALFKYGDKVGGADVIFGEKDDSTLLGVFTLEALGLTLDSLKRELRPLPMIVAGPAQEAVLKLIMSHVKT